MLVIYLLSFQMVTNILNDKNVASLNCSTIIMLKISIILKLQFKINQCLNMFNI